jgi:hypothetical protein
MISRLESTTKPRAMAVSQTGSAITCARERPVLSSLRNANVGENADKENSFGGEELA